MHIVDLALRSAATAGAAVVNGEALADIFWSHAYPADRLEHVRVGVSPEYLGVVLFLQVKGANEAEAAARSLCERLIGSVPALEGWAIVRSRVAQPEDPLNFGD